MSFSGVGGDPEKGKYGFEWDDTEAVSTGQRKQYANTLATDATVTVCDSEAALTLDLCLSVSCV